MSGRPIVAVRGPGARKRLGACPIFPSMTPSNLEILTSKDRPSPRRLALRVGAPAERALRAGHPWLFDESITSLTVSGSADVPRAGDIAVVFDVKRRFLAAGIYDPDSPIRVRVLVHSEPDEIGQDFFRRRIATALERRRDVASEHTTAFRVLSGGSDGMAGLVADLYDRSLVLQLFSPAWLPHLDGVVAAFEELLAPERVLLLAAERVTQGDAYPAELRDGTVLRGAPAKGGIPFLETGLRFEAHPLEGHKTGFYLDQRMNRRRLEAQTAGARVLNVFAYTGAFSVYAARGRAREVVSVDVAAPALAQAERHFELNADDPAVAACRHRTMRGDAFDIMAAMADDGDRFDCVVVDPPSFTRAARHRQGALRAYRSLTRLALPLLRPGGLLVQASCSSRIGADEFFAGVEGEARATGRSLTRVERTGHPPDHPIGFPEAEYLKCLWGRVE
jgi:23S rRNA (cytosine1962-C5)-methyltransferase